MTQALNRKITPALLSGRGPGAQGISMMALNLAYRPILSATWCRSCPRATGTSDSPPTVTSSDDLGQISAGINRFIEQRCRR